METTYRRVKFITGSWTNDDVDLLPAIKLRTGTRKHSHHNVKVKATSLALCWLKWGIMVSYGKVIKF